MLARQIPEMRRIQMLRVANGALVQPMTFFLFLLNKEAICDWALQYLNVQGKIGEEFLNWYRRDFESDPQKLIRHLRSIAPQHYS